MNPWRLCRCGHSMLLHDVEDMDGTNPQCCVDGCDQRGCREMAGDPMIGPYETRRCDWCQQPVAECECELDPDDGLGCPCGHGCWDDDPDDVFIVERPPAVVTIDPKGLL